MFHDVAADFQELSFVFYRNESFLDSVVASELEGLGEGANLLDVALNAHVAEDHCCCGNGCVAKCREGGNEEGYSDFGFDSVVE